LIRLESSGPAFWFKAAGPPNLREVSITVALSLIIPEFVPKMIAMRPDWNAWLAAEATGNKLSSISDLEEWKNAATYLAELQIAAIGNQTKLLNSGAHDLTTRTLSKSLGGFLASACQLMERQTKLSPPSLRRNDILALGNRIRDALCAIEISGIPESLGHLDLSSDNIIVSSRGCIFLDWAEAYVGHPFLSFNYLLEHFRRAARNNPSLESEMREAYAAPWTKLASHGEIANALNHAPLVAVFAYAFAISVTTRQEGSQEFSVGPYLRSLTRRMKYEADHLTDRGAACLS